MTDTKPKKTLSLKSKSASPAIRPDNAPRQRTGARAKAAAQARRQREQQGHTDQDTPESRKTRNHRSSTPRTETQYAPRALPEPEIETFPIFASCPQGLEDALSAELQALGFEDAVSASAGCRFRTNWTGVMRANLYSRLATRILMQVAHAPVKTEDDIFKLALHTSWERWFGPDHTLRVDTSAIRSPMHSLQFCNLRAKDGICDRLREYEGARPNIDTVRPDAKVHLFLDENSATLYLDTSGESLFKRGWRFSKGDAPIRENLAAGLLALSGWDPSQP